MDQLILMVSSHKNGPFLRELKFKDVLSRVKAYINSHDDVRNDPDRWIGGMGWDQTKWHGGEFPTAVSSGYFFLLV
jgi:hypothetical protein